MRVKAVRGTRDILPEEISLWQEVEEVACRIFKLYGYKEIRTPIFEETRLFERAIGDGTEIVTKQMYTFLDKKGRSITLRPEATAGVVRAYIEHNLKGEGGIAKFYYIGPMFRYERPQAGRQRQFYQLGTELLGSSHPARDAELIGMVIRLFNELGLLELETEINSVGCQNCQPAFISALRDYFYKERPCLDCQRRLERNPLRILDCKNDICKEIISRSPVIDEYLCKECLLHIKEVKMYLELLDVSYITNPRLVRGLDYYTRTVFEVIKRDKSQNVLAAGGRYDRLVEDLGGISTPALGFAAGIERIVSLLRLVRGEVEREGIDIYISSIDEAADKIVLKIVDSLRKAGFIVRFSCESRSARKEARLANRLKGRFLMIIGEDELRNEMVRPKDMVAKKELDAVLLTDVVEWFKEVLTDKKDP